MLIQGLCLFFTSISNIFELIVFRSPLPVKKQRQILHYFGTWSKIGRTYFKIQGTYFKISALYFFFSPMCV